MWQTNIIYKTKVIYRLGAIQEPEGITANFFKRVSLIISLNIALFTTSKAFSIYSLSSLFIGSQGRIKLSNIKIHRVIYKTFKIQRQIAL